MKIAVDLDGVVWDIMRIFVKIYNRIYSENIKYEDIDDWYYFPQERFEHVYPLTLQWIMDYPVLDNYVDVYIYDLKFENDITILTAELNTVKVLKKKLDSIHIHKGTHYDKFIRIDPKKSKLDYEFDVYIDDNPNMAKEMHKYPKRTLLLYDQLWNQNFDDSKCENVWRVSNWDEIMLAVDIIKQRKQRKRLL